MQLLPRSSTAERMNPYTSMWTGVHPGDGPQDFHLVLLDNGRTRVLGDPVGRAALHCIRCSACLNVCPVYERTGGHAYGSVYPGPIGAILSPQLTGIRFADVARSAELVELAFAVTEKMLKKGGNFVAKIFPGPEADEIFKRMQPTFEKLSRHCLKSSRTTSNEFYVVGRGFREGKKKD